MGDDELDLNERFSETQYFFAVIINQKNKLEAFIVSENP